MGFDPRRWRPAAAARPPVTCNVEALLAENDALRREVRTLRLQLERSHLERLELERLHLAQQQRERDARAAQHPSPSQPPSGSSPGRGSGRSRVTSSASHGLSAELVERWGTAMARHPQWTALRIGPPHGLRELVEELRRRWWNPQLTLEQELDRRSPGLGAELTEALRGPHSRSRWAVRAAFALYGPRAPEWLNEEPLRVVEDLRRRLAQLEQRAPGRRRGTRTENHSGNPAGAQRPGSQEPATESQEPWGSQSRDRQRRAQQTSQQTNRQTSHQTSGRQGRGGAGQTGGRQGGGRERDRAGRSSRSAADPHSQALQVLGLEAGASLPAIKRAYRRLAKAHHPDLGGDVQAFHRLDAAYRLLVGWERVG